MSLKALSDYTLYSRYARYNKTAKRRETWPEMVDRVFAMHAIKFSKQLEESSELREDFDFAKEMMLKKRVLGSQRALQFGGHHIFKHNAKMYNCSFGYLDRVRAFQEFMYLLLCGCGVGFSVQTHHIAKLPDIAPLGKHTKIFKAEDSIEGWSDCVGALVSSYFVGDTVTFPEYQGKYVEFDLTAIRPEGALIAGQFIAPGPKELSKRLGKMREIFEKCLKDGRRRLKPIEAYDIVMHASCAVLSGGVRRSATICLFSPEDKEMMNAKVGSWMDDFKHRSRSNNSVLLVRNETSLEQFQEIMKSTREFGEPGFVWADHRDIGVNPCVSADTMVSTSTGDVRMDDLVEKVDSGERVHVKSFDIYTGQTVDSLVTAAALTRKNADLLEIEFENDKRIRVTPDHRIFTSNRGYVSASELTTNDDIVSLGEECTDYEYSYEIGISANWRSGLQYDNESGVSVFNIEGLGEIPVSSQEKSTAATD